ncbi:carboxypeptidase-like regulatory domain-containing protein [Spongiimicrobium sp. 3-5]|uniref:carboxypeptidase-like regulatory domain-containing protein n=1 Tax=Spongiimicrobium sp. 3-5 TaxID=3332596 RepID=UPI00397FD75C
MRKFIIVNKILLSLIVPLSLLFILRNRYLMVMLFISIQGLFAQKTLVGTILDQETGKPVDYANIGVIDQTIGTVSDNDGTFNLVLKELNQIDSVQISRIGYTPLRLSTSDLHKRISHNPVIFLQEEVYQLQEVVVDVGEVEKNRIGYSKTTKNLIGFWNDSLALGGEHASKILVRKGPIKLEDLSFNIIKSISDSILVRVNVYDIEKGLPGRNISKRNILYTIKKKSGREIIDLSPYDIVVNNHFIVSLELLKIYGGKVGIAIAAFNDGARSYTRLISQDRWRRIRKGTTIAFNLNTSPLEGDQASFMNIQKKNKKPKSVKVLWDNSLSMENRDLKKELNYLDLFFERMGDVKVSFQSFGYKLGQEKSFEIRKGQWNALKAHIEQIENDGATNIDVLEQLNTEEFTLLFTDGARFMTDVNQKWYGKIFPINTHKKGNHELLAFIAEESDGSYINLTDLHDIRKATDYRRMKGNYTSKNKPKDAPPKLIIIRGSVSDFDDPIERVLVQVKNTNRKTRTDTKGNFTILAEAGETLMFTYPGRIKVEAAVNYGTSNLSITMPLGVKVLDEVVLEDKRKGLEKLSVDAMGKKKVSTNFGVLDPESTGFAIRQIEGDLLNTSSQTLTDALRGKFAGVRIVGNLVGIRGNEALGIFAAWDIDGLQYPPDGVLPPIDVTNVQHITIMPGSWAAARYGRMAAGGIIIVRTKNQSFEDVKVEKKSLYDQTLFRNNGYKGEAIFPEHNAGSKPKYLQEIAKAKSLGDAYQLYLQQRSLYQNMPHFFSDVHHHLLQKWNARDMALLILSNIAEKFPEDVNAQRLLAYSYEQHGLYTKSLSIYKRILDLKPTQAQSQRDLAKAFVNNGDYKEGWKLYKKYLNMEHKDPDTDGLYKIVKREMRDLAENYYNVLGLDKDSFTFDQDQEDISIIVQWNNPNAEFELQFVGPLNRYYTWSHTKTENQQLLKEERKKGCFSKSFGIQDIGAGPWILNTKYIGNLENTPTHLKFTIRENNKSKETVKVLKLQQKNVNYRFLDISATNIAVFH